VVQVTVEKFIIVKITITIAVITKRKTIAAITKRKIIAPLAIVMFTNITPIAVNAEDLDNVDIATIKTLVSHSSTDTK
jgi:hypothetical protein